jgi:hypothetical protein
MMVLRIPMFRSASRIRPNPVKFDSLMPPPQALKVFAALIRFFHGRGGRLFGLK